jgi:hypothetical protein
MADAKPKLQLCDGKNARAWVLQAGNVLALLCLIDARYQQAPLAIAWLVAHLVGNAAQWIQAIRAQHNGGLPWESVQEFFGDLRARFEPVDSSIVNRQALVKLRQTASVAAYNSRFMDLLLGVDGIDHNGEGLWRYLEGLKPAVAGHVFMYRPHTLQAAMQYAQTADAFLWQARSHGHQPSGPSPMELGAMDTQGPRSCHICKAAGHMWRRCPNAKEHPCKKCGKVGHPTIYCRSTSAGKASAAN